jgi:hypothetical protein
MKIKASGRLALMVAAGLTGLLVGLTGPLPAHAAGSDASASKADSTETSTQQSSRQGRRHARHQSSKSADKSSADKSEAKKATGKDAGSVTSAGMPATVANANAELTSGVDNPGATPVKANALIAAADKPADQQPEGVVASDQLNDVDRALQQEQPPSEQPQPVQQPAQAAQQEAPPAQPPMVVTAAPKPAPVLASSDSASLDQTSLIGKIFIGFGALLTVASAARMFMA